MELKPAVVYAQLDTAMSRFPGSASSSVDGGSHRVAPIEVATCRKLCEDGHMTQAVDAMHALVEQGRDLDITVLYRVLRRCIGQKDLVLGRRIHALTLRSGHEGNSFLATHLIGLYASHGRLDEAMRVFSRVIQPSAHMWAAIIFAYARHGEPRQAIRLYRQLERTNLNPDNRIFVAVLKACASAGDLSAGKDVHARVIARAGKPDIFVQNSLVHMYAKCCSIHDARRVFDSLFQKDVVTWTAMVAGYAQQGMGQESLAVYSSMQKEDITPPNSVTFVCLLQACASVGAEALHQGKQLHAQIVERGFQTHVIVGASLVDMYAKCGSLQDGQQVFDRLSQKDVVTWNAMIAGYAQQGLCQEAFALYRSMQQEGITPPSSVTFVCMLQACASAAALTLGKQLHAEIKERGLQADEVVGPSLVNTYAKCGSLEDAQQVFDALPKREIGTWNALIVGYARKGDSQNVFALVHRMRQDGIQPNNITFLSVLTVCSHVGLVDKGRNYFNAITTDYGITPTTEHYRCMMDLLGRAGHLEEALQMVKTMPFQPDSAVWLTLLGSCRKWRNVAVGQQAFEFAVKLDEKDAAAYALMSNIYSSVQMWKEAQEMQALRVKCGAWKKQGQSWCTDMDGVMHGFVVAF